MTDYEGYASHLSAPMRDKLLRGYELAERKTKQELWNEIVSEVDEERLFAAVCFMLKADKVKCGEISEDDEWTIPEPEIEIDNWLNNATKQQLVRLRLIAEGLVGGREH